MNLNTENYENRQRKAKKMYRAKKKKKAHDPKMLERMEEASKRNETRKFYVIAHRMDRGWFQAKNMFVKQG